MAVTVGKFEVRCVALGTPGGKWTGQWSIYLRPIAEGDNAADEGVSDPMDNAGDAEREGLREAVERARLLDAGTTGIEPYSDY